MFYSFNFLTEVITTVRSSYSTKWQCFNFVTYIFEYYMTSVWVHSMMEVTPLIHSTVVQMILTSWLHQSPTLRRVTIIPSILGGSQHVP